MANLRSMALVLIFSVCLCGNALAAAPAGAGQGEWVADVAQKVIPSVVNISSSKTVTVRPLFRDPFFGNIFGDRPQERVQKGLGSGVIVSPDGFIITNNHVVSGADKIEIRLWDNRQYPARIVGADPESDVAVVKIEATNLPAIAIGDSDRMRIGSFVLAVGNPFGLDETVTMGIVSALGRSGLGITDYENFIQTDAAINPGNSGGALVNMRGELIGINTAIFSRSGGSVGIGFAIPVNLAMAVKGNLVKYGKMVRGYLGVQTQDLDPKLAKSLGLSSTKGVVVTDVTKASPAARAGIQRGDVIKGINGKSVENAAILRLGFSELPPGTQAKITVSRAGKELVLPVTVGDLAKATQEDNRWAVKGNRFLDGLSASDITPDMRDNRGLPKDLAGVIVVAVAHGSAAEANRLQPGDIILKLNNAAIKNLQDFKKAVAGLTGRKMAITINRGGMVINSTIIR